MGHAIFLLRLRDRKLVVSLQLQTLPVHDIKNGVCAPVRKIGLAAARLAAATPLVGEEDLGAVVVERRGVPVGEVWIRHLIEANRI